MSLVDVFTPSYSVRRSANTPAWHPDRAIDVFQGIRLEQVTAAEWDTLASGFEDVNQEQTHCFCAAKWGEQRVDQVVVKHDDQVLGGAAVVILALPGTSCALSLVKWGPLWRRPGLHADPQRLRMILTALKQEYAESRGHYLSVFPHADPTFSEVTCGILRDLGFRPSWSHNDPDRYLVNLALSPDELRSSLGQKWRYNLKKSEANGLEIVEFPPVTGMPQFMKLYREMLARKGFHDSSAIATLPSLMQSDVPALRPKIFLVLHDGRPTAGAVIDTCGERAVYLYGATDERALGLKAGYALHWWIAERLCRDARKLWYDLGGKDSDDGLHQFKKGFVGKQGAIIPTPPSFEFAPSRRAQTVGRAIFALRDAKATVDDALYRARALLAA